MLFCYKISSCLSHKLFLHRFAAVLALPHSKWYSNKYGRKLNFETFGGEFRVSHGLPQNSNAYGVLTDLPDYTYLDGRPTELSVRQKKRKEEKLELAKKVDNLIYEVKFAVSNKQRKDEETRLQHEQIVKKRLKPKS